MRHHTARQILQQTLAFIYQKKYTFLLTAFMLQLFISELGAAALEFLFKLALILADQANLDKNNLMAFITHPWSLLVILSFLVSFTLLLFFELSVLIYVIYASQNNDKLSYLQLLKESIRKIKYLVGKEAFIFLGYFILTIPISGLILTSSLAETLAIPSFITGELMKTPLGMIGMTLAYMSLIYLNIRLIYALPLMIVKDQLFSMCLQESWQMTRKGKLKILTIIGLFELALAGISLLIILMITLVATLMDPEGQNIYIQAISLTVLQLGEFFFNAVSKIGIFAVLLTAIKGSIFRNEKIFVKLNEQQKFSKWLVIGIAAMSFIVVSLNIFSLNNLKINQHQVIIAHRTDVSQAVENSLEGLESAARKGAPIAEIDILLTKDHKFVVIHDYNLKRLANLNQKVKNMTYDELVGLPLMQNGFVTTLSSFDDFVIKAQELNIELLVELKPHGEEPENYVDLFIEKMKSLNIETQYKVMSLDLKVMEDIETKAPAIKTGYVIPLQFGPFANNHVDFFVIEDFSYRDELVAQAHEMGKEVFVWTINDEETIETYIQRPVDGIITDEIELSSSVKRYLQEEDNYTDRLFRLLNMKFK